MSYRIVSAFNFLGAQSLLGSGESRLWPSLDRAAKLVLARADPLDGNAGTVSENDILQCLISVLLHPCSGIHLPMGGQSDE